MLSRPDIVAPPAERPSSKVETAIAQLTSLQDGDLGVIAAIGCGSAAIPALKRILVEPEPSGFYETRRRAIDALEGLKAFGILRAYLAAPNDPTDPVQRAGEDAVMSAAAKALGSQHDARNLPLLWSLIRSRPLAGVIEALGTFRQPQAIPHFIEALGDDFLRPSAEEALRKLGRTARRALVDAALTRPAMGYEARDSINRRRSAIALLEEFRPKQYLPFERLLGLVDDSDPWIAFRASRLCLPQLSDSAAKLVILKLILRLKRADSLLAEEIGDILIKYYRLAETSIKAFYKQPPSDIPPWRTTDHTQQVFDRVTAAVARSSNKGPEE